jgi:alanine-glyoxylate transaminase/serine-glyoxylate transaminase/serine-pyruvate transaminase
MPESYPPLQPPKRLLLGPGPTTVEPRVYAAMQLPIVSHVDPYFYQVTEEIRLMLGPIFGTESPFRMVISGTGSSGMETAIINFTDPGTKFAVFAAGYFCDRITDIARRQGAQVVRLEKAWGETFTGDEARDFIAREKPDIVAYVQAETSTGVYLPGKAICEAAHEHGALVIADCVTSLGAMPVEMDANGIDIAYSCSQKGLSCPPGLAPIALSLRALERLHARTQPLRSFYFDLKLLDDYYDGAHRYHHTAPISMFYALREALAIITEEGLQARFARHRRNHLAFVAGIEALGLRMHVPDPANRLWSLNTPRVPEGINDAKVRARMLAERGIDIFGGFGPLAGKIFRVGLMGASSTQENVLLVLEALESALRAEGFTPAASGRAAAEQFYAANAV